MQSSLDNMQSTCWSKLFKIINSLVASSSVGNFILIVSFFIPPSIFKLDSLTHLRLGRVKFGIG